MENRVLSSAHRHRLLAAIMMTDAVGFSTRMSVDEESTLKLIDRDLALIADLCETFEGNLLKSTGDGLLMYFVSAVQAVSCGLEIQQRLADLIQASPDSPFLMHRIGIHLGDILVSETDVMGNGVNIAARLQTYAKPGGLCISQTIYDVVKPRLHLNAEFLGPLTLKNIQEPVPAFQVDLLPHPSQAEMSVALNEATRPLTITPEVLLHNAVTALTTHPHHQRIKKLLFAGCQQVWENDEAVLSQFELAYLIGALTHRYPTLLALKSHLDRIVGGLNRRASYEAVVTAILNQLEPLYRYTIEATRLKAHVPHQEITALRAAQDCTGLMTDDAQWRYPAIATVLEQTPDALRLRKLLYCICHNAWENDAIILQSYPLANLVQQVHEIAPTRRDLKYQLGRIVKRLNRRVDYTRLANLIIEQFHSLYEVEQYATQLSAPSGGDAIDTGSTTVTCIEPPVPRSDMTALQTSLATPPLVEAAPPLEMTQAARDRSNLFELRQEIMRYTNPLRAKILLYSCLHGPFSFHDQEWSALRGKTLDHLLQEAFDYCPTLVDLESKLTILSHCLDNSEDNMQVAGAITQAMKAYYPETPPGEKPRSADPKEPPSQPMAPTPGVSANPPGNIALAPVSLSPA